jgi:hypothetical protein
MNFPTRSAAALTALTAMFVAAPVAFADDPGVIGAPVSIGCGYSGTNVFAAWGDDHNYALTPDGGFENGAAGWALDGQAATTDGNENFQVGGPSDHQSLNLPAGSSATSPSFCVSRREDTVRLFVRTDSGRRARLKVEAIYTDAANGDGSERVDKLRATESWDASGRLKIALPDTGSRLSTTNVSLRFTPLDGDSFQIDDVYVDPRLRN